jgi:cell division protein FtsB
LAYDGERADAAALDQLEIVLRHVMDELTTWHTRALKAETDRGSSPAAATRGAELEQENKQLRQRVEAAGRRVNELLSRLTFLEDQARDQASEPR